MDKRPLKVFLCHAHADRDPVRALYSRLTQDGVDAWLDKAKLLPGQDWELEIRKAVREADVVVVCLSKQFNQAGFRQKEVRLALDTAMEKPEGEIFIIPARLEEYGTIESLRRWHWVDLFEEDGYENLMRSLRLRAEKIGAILDSSYKEPFVDKKIEQEKKLKILQRQAESFEAHGQFSKALEIYYEIEKIDPFIFGLDQKIIEIEKKINSNNRLMKLLVSDDEARRAKSAKFESVSARQKPRLADNFLPIFAIIGIVGIVCLGVLITYVLSNRVNLNSKPTVDLTSTVPVLVFSTPTLPVLNLNTEAPTMPVLETPTMVLSTTITNFRVVNDTLGSLQFSVDYDGSFGNVNVFAGCYKGGQDTPCVIWDTQPSGLISGGTVMITLEMYGPDTMTTDMIYVSLYQEGKNGSGYPDYQDIFYYIKNWSVVQPTPTRPQ